MAKIDRLAVERFVSILVFITGISMLVGADSYKDFYYEVRSRATGEMIDYSLLADFCGWTGGPLPGESDLSYGFRAFWNMLSAMMAMSVIANLAFGIFFGIILMIAYKMGAFRQTG